MSTLPSASALTSPAPPPSPGRADLELPAGGETGVSDRLEVGEVTELGDQLVRRVFLARGACDSVRKWIEVRGDEAGPLLCPVSAAGEVRTIRLRGESVHYILKKRQREAGLDGITPHDFRRGYVSGLLAAGVDAVGPITMK